MREVNDLGCFVDQDKTQSDQTVGAALRDARYRPGFILHDEYELFEALCRERYFIIVTAFDFQELLTNKQWKRLWSTRFNVRTAGIRFKDAHLAMSSAAAPYYGTKMEKLGKGRSDRVPLIEEIQIGDIEVLETIEGPLGPGMLNALRMREQR